MADEKSKDTNDENTLEEIDQSAAQNENAKGDGVDKEFERVTKELLYLRAEFDNYRKRMSRDQDQAIRFANERLIRELLSVVDLFERALGHGKTLPIKGTPLEKEVGAFVGGIEMTRRELVQLLGRFGVELTGSVGEKFDPNRHEAISQKPVKADEEGLVVDVLQKGCLLNGRLLAPARVVVGVVAN